ncbi:tail fiber domain-containing protein [Bacteroides sp. BFG-257]|uniref:tail fiber domain-containing protein n=1 Tax=Bacteroides TaxID=816 RepID=UPI001CC921AE|nr:MULTISPECIES: tail fiber domain-containing protein [Bacteroides]UBD71184.1 tail fiber domain-containing protein [Bacteroides cellulosilyticus]UVO99815.1 tail fiber domain-containing protein [Bacteroides sp. BFG-257]
MKTKMTTISKAILALALLIVCTAVNAQIKYDSNGWLTIGNTTRFGTYNPTILSNGIYIKGPGSNFFQVDVTPAATRLASHYDQVVFFNTQTSTFNSIQVKNVYNYSDARAKTNIQTLSQSLSIINQLRPVSYNFTDNSDNTQFRKGGDGKEIGLLAQEVEKILPNAVLTDPDGNKLINYTNLIAVLINAVKDLSTKVSALEAKQ